MGLIVINDRVKSKIKQIIEHAQKNRFTVSMLEKILMREDLPKDPVDDENFFLVIPRNLKVVYLEQYQSCGVCRQLIASFVGNSNKRPSIDLVNCIMKLFKFQTDLINYDEKNLDRAFAFYLEEYNNMKCINVIEGIKKNE